MLGRIVQCVGYADGVALIARTERNRKETFVVLEREARKVDAQIHEEKT